MELYIVRHAEAEPATPETGDAARPLTRRGRDRFGRSVRGLERLGVTLDRVYHSPLLRAVETAELLVPLLDNEGGESFVTQELARGPREELLEEVEGERVALVGHEPYVSELLALLVLGWRVFEPRAQQGLFEFEKGAVAHLTGELQAGSMALVAFWPSKTLRKLSKH
jgi:phosphohistidine phosphatase